MKKYFHSKISATALLALITSMTSQAQILRGPIDGDLSGQAIVACTAGYGSTYEYAATDAAVYSRPMDPAARYTSVWTAPGDLRVISMSNTINHRALLLYDAAGNAYASYNNINAPAPDVTVNGPILLPTPVSGSYTKIACGLNAYAFAYLNGGPPGNIYTSRNNGRTWSLDTLGIGLDAIYDMAIDTAMNVVICSPGGIYLQRPNDSVWTLLNNSPMGETKIFVDQQNRILVSNYGINTRISTNNGASFVGDSAGLSWQVSVMGGDVYGNLYAVAGGQLYRNTGGTSSTWVNIMPSLNLASGSGVNIACISGDSLLTLGSGNFGMFTSTSHGNVWTSTNSGIHAEDIFSIITQPDGRRVCTTDLGMFYKDAADSLWHRSTLNQSFYPGTQLSNDPAGNIFVAVSPTFGSPYALGRSTDNGVTFSVDSVGFSSIGGSGFYIDETGDRHFYNFYATGSDPLTVWTSTFGTTTWHLDTLGMPVFPIYGTGVKGFCSDKRGYLYASVDEPGGVVFYRRPIHGTAWTLDTVGIGTTAIIQVMASNAALGLFAVAGMSIYHRGANGWATLSPLPSPGGTGNSGIVALSVDVNNVLYAAYSSYSSPDSNGVYYSTDTGATWHLAGLTGFAINQVVSYGDTTYALTMGKWGYVFMSGVNTGITTISPAVNNIRVYPNPSGTGIWNIQTTEEWIGSKAAIYDVSGRIVYSSVINQTSTQLNAQNLSAGAYVLRISNETNTSNHSLVK